MDKATKAAAQNRHEGIGRKFADKIRSRVTAVPKRRGPARASAPFRRTFDSAKQAAEEFYGQNIDFVRPLVETGEPREAVREWLRSNHGKTGRMRVKDSSETPWAQKIIQASNPIRAALTNVFGHAKNRRWDQVDWDSIRALGEAMVDAATDTSGPMGWYWYPVATEDDDAKILDRLSVEGDMDAYRRFAKTLSAKEVERVADTYAEEVKRLSECMPADRRRRVKARIEEIRSWAEKGIPETVCGQQAYAGHTCDLEPIHGEMQRLREACSSDAAFTSWLNSAVSRSPRPGSVAELEDAHEDMPGFVPASAFEGDPDARQSTPEDACTPSNAAKVMGRLAAKKRRENAAKRKKVRETNAALRKAERERVSAERKAQRKSRRVSKKSASKGRSPSKTLSLTHQERVALGGSAHDKALFEKHGKGRVGRLVVDYIDGSITAAENRELEALGLAKNDMLTDDGWVLYKSIKGDGDPRQSFVDPKPPWQKKTAKPTAIPVLDVFTSDVMGKVKPKHVAKAIKVLVEQERLLPPGHSLSARTPRQGIVYLTARAKRVDHEAVTKAMQRLFPDYRERRGAQQELHLVPNHYEKDVLKTIASRYADSLRVLALREAGVKTDESTVVDQPVPKVNDTALRPGSPVKCGGEWCVEVFGQISIGDPLHVSTRRGKTWNAVVTEIVKTYTKSGATRTVVRSAKLPPELLRGKPVDMLSADGRKEARPPMPGKPRWSPEQIATVFPTTESAKTTLKNALSRRLNGDAPTWLVTVLARPLEPMNFEVFGQRQLHVSRFRIRIASADETFLREHFPEVSPTEIVVDLATPSSMPTWMAKVIDKHVESNLYTQGKKQNNVPAEAVRTTFGLSLGVRSPRLVAVGDTVAPREVEGRVSYHTKKLFGTSTTNARATVTRIVHVARIVHDGQAFTIVEAKPIEIAAASTPPRPRSEIPKSAQGSLVTPEQEGFALTHPKGTAAVHGKSAGTGGTQSTLPGVSRKVSTQKMIEMKERERAAKVAKASTGKKIDSPNANEVKFTVMPRRIDPMLVGLDEYPDLMNLPRTKHVSNEIGGHFTYVVPAKTGRARSSEAIDAWVPSSPEGAERFLVYVGRNRTLSGYIERELADGRFSAHVAKIADSSFGGRGPTGFESTGRVLPSMHEAIEHIVRRS